MPDYYFNILFLHNLALLNHNTSKDAQILRKAILAKSKHGIPKF